jgi:predicted DNA-binding ribbon-helix-helix protein
MRKFRFFAGPALCPGSDRRTAHAMKSLVMKRSVVIAGHRTSVSLEEAFWKSLEEIASYQNMTVSALIAAIDSERHYGNLSSTIRSFVINFYREQLDIQERSEALQEAIGRSVPGFN